MKGDLPLSVKINSFIFDPNAGTVTGKRRMGTDALLDAVAEEISKDPKANVIRVTEEDGAIEYIRARIGAEKKNHVLLYAELAPKEAERIMKEFPDAQIYRVKELCHQVPACFKEAAAPGGGR